MKITIHVSTLLKIIGASVLIGAVIQEFGRAKAPSAGMIAGVVFTIVGVWTEPPRKSHQL